MVVELSPIMIVISIHAPAKGATLRYTDRLSCCFHFNPRTREGCDASGFPRPATKFYFNPRTREGCDTESDEYGVWYTTISIHAPAKGATIPCLLYVTIFQFQSTHPRRVRLHRHAQVNTHNNFNPRTREGCDALVIVEI